MMEIIELIINNPIAAFAVISLGFNLILIKLHFFNSTKVMASDSLIKDKDKKIDGLIAEINALKKEKEETISNISKEHNESSQALNNEIKELKEKESHKKPPPLNYPPTNIV